MKNTTQKKTKKQTGRTDKKRNHPKFTAKAITQDNLELFLETFIEQHRNFALEYSLCFNAAKAYKLTHPDVKSTTAKTNGHQLLKTDKVQMYLDWLALAKRKKFDFDEDVYAQQIEDYYDQAKGGKEVLDSDGDSTGEFRFDSSGTGKALELKGKMFGQFISKIKIEEDGKIPHFIVHHHVVPEIKPVDMADTSFQEDITDAVKKYLKERLKNR